jgi:DNA-binding NtrC family response regulator
MSSKINQLPPRHRPKFIEKLIGYDLEVGKACSAIKDTLSKIVEKQYDLADNFIELVDEVLRVESNNLEDETNVPQQTRNSDDSVGQSSKYHYFSYMQNSIQSTF